ncbi:MAG: D-alanine--D-alanine ligase [Elusimicrobiota bacterium]|jgi:D-alanine-D-alanine ligase|nr:D-alanine--D-alanine ligase [Elusimicrobiota bacterium]
MDLKNLKNKKIGVLYGGLSSEREISIKSGKSVLKALKQLGLNACAILVDKNAADKIKQAKIDIAFPVLHGTGGEDGTIQGLLEIMQIPYTGCGIFSSSASIDKNISKKLFRSEGLNTPDWFTVKQFEPIPEKIKYPIIVKPANGGSTIGISIASNYSSFLKAVKEAFKYDKLVLAEQFIKGKEITAAVLDGEVLPIIEIVPKGGFYDFKAKYQKGGSRHIIPARISSKAYAQAQKYALSVYKLFMCRSICRVDMIVDKSDKVWILENNTLPGMTNTSLLPDAAKYAGISFNEIVLKFLKDL